MKRLCTTLGLVAAFAASIHAAPLGPGFTYQGKLNDTGVPANGKYDMVFNLYDAPTNGNVLGNFSIFGGVPVTNGLFNVELNAYGEFGTNAFNGQARWLQIGVRTNSNNAMNPWIFLNPRQPLDSTPQAMFAEKAGNAAKADQAATVADGAITASKLAPGSLAWSNINGIPAGFADGSDDMIFYKAGKGLNLDWLFEFSVNFAGSGSANSVARSDHGHFGANWGGSAYFGSGLSVTNGANNSAGLYGQQGTGSGFPYLFGNTTGVWGESSQGNGVWGASGHTNGNGVVGLAATTNGSNAGVTGRSISTSGAGVRGVASATTGETVGVRGESASGQGSGVTGVATALSGDATGVHGESAAVHGMGVFGKATFVSGNGPNYGVVGQSDSLWGYGVYGHAASPNGINYGVVGEAHSVGGIGVVARNTNGVAFKAQGTGIIQSDADSYIWIPGSAGFSYAGGWQRSRAQMLVSGNAVIEFPLTLPGMLYGQNTVLKSIEVFYDSGAGQSSFISATTLYDDNDSVLYTDSSNHASDTKASYTVPLNYHFSNASGSLLLSIFCDVNDYWIIIHGIKVRLGHK